MAYVPVEDRLFLDVRFRRLASEVGEPFALAALIQAWRTARDYYLESVRAERTHLGVPRKVFFNNQHADEILKCGLATASECGEFVTLSGIERVCESLKVAIVSGRLGGKKKSENHKTRNHRRKSSSPLQGPYKDPSAPLNPPSSDPLALSLTLPKYRNRDHAANVPDGPNSQHEFEGVLTDANRGLLARVKPGVIGVWMQMYPTWFIKQESERAAAWVAANPAKAPKSNFAKFMNGWLDRGYSTYRQTNDVGSQTKKTLIRTLDPIDVSYPGTDDSGESV
jgi:hypothetical protein